jgi:prevent-host-death family protein
MKTITLTELRRHYAALLTEVEKGETLVILRYGRPIAEIRPYSEDADKVPAWKEPGMKLKIPGAELSQAIMAERG